MSVLVSESVCGFEKECVYLYARLCLCMLCLSSFYQSNDTLMCSCHLLIPPLPLLLFVTFLYLSPYIYFLSWQVERPSIDVVCDPFASPGVHCGAQARTTIHLTNRGRSDATVTFDLSTLV